MKYIKLFEKKLTPKYKMGDYVIVYSEFEEIFNAIMQIENYFKDKDDNGKDILYYDCEYIGGGKVPYDFCGSGLYEEDIVAKINEEDIELVKKLTDEELELWLKAKKYNL